MSESGESSRYQFEEINWDNLKVTAPKHPEVQSVLTRSLGHQKSIPMMMVIQAINNITMDNAIRARKLAHHEAKLLDLRGSEELYPKLTAYHQGEILKTKDKIALAEKHQERLREKYYQ